MGRVKVYINQHPQKIGTGIYAEQLQRNFPLLPIEEEGRLGDPKLCGKTSSNGFMCFTDGNNWLTPT